MPRAASRPLARRSCRTLDPMGTGIWSCLSCGGANRPRSQCCVACGCPSHATVAQIEAHRESFVARGGTPSPQASLSLEPELSGAQVLGPVVLLALGVWPFPWRAISPLGLSLVVVGAVLQTVALSSGPVFEVSALRAAEFIVGFSLVLLGLCGGKLLGRTVRRGAHEV